MKVLLSALIVAMGVPALAGTGQTYWNVKPTQVPTPQGTYPPIAPIPIPVPNPTYTNIDPALVPSPMIESVTPTQAMRPGEVIATGSGLAYVKHVTIAGLPAQILSASENELIVMAPSTDPGFMTLRAEVFPMLASEAFVEMCPSLYASVLGNSVDVRIGSGEDGMYLLAANLELRPIPLVLTKPLTDYMFFLEEDFVVLSSGLMLNPTELLLGFEVPPALAGFTLHLQAWVRQNYAPKQYAHCFTNMFSVQL